LPFDESIGSLLGVRFLFMALIGVICAVVFLSRWHDVQLSLLAVDGLDKIG